MSLYALLNRQTYNVMFHKVAAVNAKELYPAFTWVRTTVDKLLLGERNALVGRRHIFGASPYAALYVNTKGLSRLFIIQVSSEENKTPWTT